MTEDRIQDQNKQPQGARDFGAREDFDRNEREPSMNQGRAQKGNINDELKGKLKQTWSRLNDQDIALFTSGKHDRFYDTLEEKHGVMRDEAEEQIEDLKQSCGCSSSQAA
jgi:hypothetical protein